MAFQSFVNEFNQIALTNFYRRKVLMVIFLTLFTLYYFFDLRKINKNGLQKMLGI
jgi:hypothetical protein